MEKHIHAREILQLTKDELWATHKESGNWMVTDDLGEVFPLTGPEICMAYYNWLPIKQYPLTKLRKEHTLSGRFNKKGTLLDLRAAVGYDIRDTYGEPSSPHYDPHFDFDELGKWFKQLDAELYNDVSSKIGDYVSTLKALDYRHLYNYPPIKEIRDELMSHDYTKPGVIMNSEKYVAKAHAAANRILSTYTPELQNNNLYRLCFFKQIDVTQIIKQILFIGHGCDMDNSIYPRPIATNYAKGLRRLYDTGIDARSGSRSLAWQADPLEQTEYANRESQILVDIITTLKDEDCGSTLLIPWIPRKEDLRGLQGMNYSLKAGDNSDLKHVTTESTDIVGKLIYLRNAITCMTDDPAGICKVCYGELHKQLPKRSSIGRVGIFILSSDVSQKVLSLKHDGGTAVSKPIVFTEEDQGYVYSVTESQTIYIHPRKDAKEMRLNISRKYVENLAYIYRVRKVQHLDVGMVSEVRDFTIDIVDQDGDIFSKNINLGVSAKCANLTHEFLEHIRKCNVDITQSEVVIDLKDWDFDRPILAVPRKHYSMLDFLAEFKKEVQNSDTTKNNLDLTVVENISYALNDFYTLTSSKFFVNITHLCVTMRASISRDPTKGDFRIKLGPDARFGRFKSIVPGRSIATALCYENITSFLYSTNSFNKDTKQFHPYDNIIVGDL